MNMVRGGPGGRLRMKRSSIENEEMSLSYQAVKPVRLGMAEGGGREMWERGEDVCNVSEGAPVEPLLAANAEHALAPSLLHIRRPVRQHQRADSSDFTRGSRMRL